MFGPFKPLCRDRGERSRQGRTSSNGATDLSVALKAAILAAYNLDSNLNDNSPNGKNLTATGSPAYAASKVGNGWVGDGTLKYGSTTGALILSGAFSIVSWAKFTGTTFMEFDGQCDRGDAISGTFGLDSTFGFGTTLRFSVTNTLSAVTAASWSGVSNDNAWHMIARGYDGTDVWISVDGGTKVTTAMVGTVRYDATPYRIGVCFKDDAPSPMTGGLDAYHIFSRNLTVAEIAYLYNGGAGRQLY